MGLLDKIFTAVKGGFNEAGEAVVDANAVRILEQEIREAEAHLENAKRDLAEVMAKEMQTARRLEELAKEIAKYETYAAQALAKNDEALASEIAGRIAELETEAGSLSVEKERFAAHVVKLKEMIRKTQSGVNDMKRRTVMVKTTESVQKATRTITDNYALSGSKMLAAKDSLDRIQKRQQDFEDKMKAGELLEKDFSGASLEEKIKRSGLGTSGDAAQDVLARLRAKQQNGGA